ncbi:tRNA (adenosine(37)-N6)-threonylcarbamoyltransferase complex ATPase subunit type 1 TsaE [Candidatus Saccharibacteria bacterium RIFCSPHIGHO2_01_FULL_45_15]|jgi:tRNA threonylcarbamoyladenosine biosynthesis protein TsaE|nr:MAG: tRNA (adenosine(37)-N6)-threonylcarbamoyltransferase complex ATPase subunit type 1 TsaE [Candidatus Saccharibacteria bacterium RIFCSPHIGHO2_01_FULL_45_15]OGL27077.1 MAG: tRNA (adenosine(37)-N6)-threonylcarbamoyltransferase complex ATPase subunit type 1 TsaE [Candidatus Saccharibacteria bacterium RIFCSPHIGHO2_02_FULL_46_12]OGL32532.1 MAG: tRNA (adenosine(37)-N6)-threonylcarbamoyltransferase complex ATPase subunit type 1 TsaE [Candidatus Saccharibacteria bacterium RIFCSPHIGHO2_12_FULL_44_22
MIVVSSEQAMKEFGQTIGASLRGGEVIELVGDVGAGKTTLVKGMAVGLMIDEDIQSPTYTINRLYTARDGITLAHYDFYRLGTAGIMADELNEVVKDSRTVTVIEWAGVVDTILPADTLRVTITATAEDERLVELTAGGDVSRRLHEAIS